MGDEEAEEEEDACATTTNYYALVVRLLPFPCWLRCCPLIVFSSPAAQALRAKLLRTDAEAAAQALAAAEAEVSAVAAAGVVQPPLPLDMAALQHALASGWLPGHGGGGGGRGGRAPLASVPTPIMT